MKKDIQNLILFGYKSSGKTFFGSLLARELNIPFVDTDLLVEKLYREEFQESGTCRQISQKLGIEGFRDLEGRVIEGLKEVSEAVIALGGGTVLNIENCQKLEKFGKLVYLEAEKNTIKQRIFLNGVPSFLDSDDPHQSFESMYEERKLIYEKISAFRVKLEGKTDQQVIQELKILKAF
jgi:shikimate kinase